MPAPTIMIVFRSMDGQTSRIAERIADRLADRLASGGGRVRCVEVTDAGSPRDADVVVIGDPIHAGRPSSEMLAYLARHREALSRVPLAMFQVSLTAADHTSEADETTRNYLAALTEPSGLAPVLVERFAGALPYTRYGWFKRLFMRRIAASGGKPTDTSRDHSFTDWEQVDAFADDILLLVPAAA